MALIFKSEAEREAALQNVSSDPADAPVGVRIDDFLSENERKLDEILNAEISEITEEPALEPEVLPEPIIEEDSELERLRKRAAKLEEDQARIIEEHEEELRKVKATLPIEQEKPSAFDAQIESLEKKIEEIQSSLNDDIDVLDEDEAKKTRELNKLL
jgi:prefoldin subunit 5